MVALSDGRLSGIHTSYRNMTVLSWVFFYLKSVKFHFLLSIGLESWIRCISMDVKIRHKLIEIEDDVSDRFVILIANYRWLRILEVIRNR